MEKLIKYLRVLKDYFFIIVIATLLVIIYFKNIKEENLLTKLEEKPQIEYVYKDSIQVIEVEKPEPYEVIKWKDSVRVETDSIPLELTEADSAQIAEAYIQLYGEFNETKFYNDTLKNDTTAFISLYEEVKRNEIYNRRLTFIDKTPIIYKTNVLTKQDRTTSIVGGIGAGDGGVDVGLGLVTKRNSVFIISHDPFRQETKGSMYLPIFNFKK